MLKLELEEQIKTYKERTGKDAKDEGLKSKNFETHRGTANYYTLLPKKGIN